MLHRASRTGQGLGRTDRTGEPLACIRCTAMCERPGRWDDGDQVLCWTCVEELRPPHPTPGRFWPGHDWVRPALAAEAAGTPLIWPPARDPGPDDDTR